MQLTALQKEGTAPVSMASTLLEHLAQLSPSEVGEEEVVARYTTAVVYGGMPLLLIVDYV